MDSKRIGIIKDLAIIVKKNENEFNASKIVTGHYIYENNIFVSDDGIAYKHLTDYNENQEIDKYFIGNIGLTSKYLNKRNDNIESSYLEEYKTYIFIPIEGKIICKNIYTSEEFYYQDQITVTNKLIEESLTNLINKIMPQEEIEENNMEELEFNHSLDELKENLKKHLKGQEEASNLLAERIFEKYYFSGQMDSNILLTIPGENEKINVINAIKKSVSPKTVCEINIPDIKDSEDIPFDENTLIVDMLNSSQKDPEDVKDSIVLISGLEKISIISKESLALIKNLQQTISRIIEGTVIPISKNDTTSEYDTKNNLFIGLFDLENYQKLKSKNGCIGFNNQNSQKTELDNQFGLTNDLLNKLPNIITINKNTVEEIYNIILNDDDSIVAKTRKILSEEYGIEIKNLEHIVKIISNDIAERKSSIKDSVKIVQKMLENIKHVIYENPKKYNELILGNNILNDNNDFILRKKEPTKKRTLTIE